MAKILIAINAFKEHLTSRETGEAIAVGLSMSTLRADCTVLPISDGGDGFLDCIQFIYSEAKERWCKVRGSDGKEISARYLVFTQSGRKHAAIEFAEVAGMRRVAIKHALDASSYGVGEMILHAISYGCTRIFLGLGGSATTDGGLGLLQALGVEFFDATGARITTSRSIDTTRVRRVKAWHVRTKMVRCDIQIVCFCDGNSSIGGKDGCWHRATHKGATTKEVRILQNGILRMIKVLNIEMGQDISLLPMTGCAGGAAGGLYAAVGAVLLPGAHKVLEMLKFDTLLYKHHVVITGEAIMDASTLTGKLPVVVAERARTRQIPCIGVAAEISCAVEKLLEAGFTSIYRVELANQSFGEIVQQKLGRMVVKQAGMLIGNMFALCEKKSLS